MLKGKCAGLAGGAGGVDFIPVGNELNGFVHIERISHRKVCSCCREGPMFV